MADEEQEIINRGPQHHHHVSGTTVVLASLAGIVAGGPLLGIMGFSFLATLTLLLIASPLLIIFSPLLFGAGCVISFALAGFGAAAAMAFTGMATFTWVFRSFRERIIGVGYGGGGRGVSDKFIESGEAVKEPGKEWAEDLQQNPQENLVNHVEA